MRASNARTSPLAALVRSLSATADPVTIIPLHHRRRRRELVLLGVVRRVAQSAPERDRAVRAEVAAHGAGLRVERDDARVDRAEVDAPAARRARRRARVEPRGDAAIREVAPVAAAVDFGVVGPALVSGRRVERDHSSEWRRQIHRPVDDERRRLELHRLSRGFARLAGAIRPRDGKSRDVRPVDLRDRRESAAEWIATVGGPVSARLCREWAGNGQDCCGA